MGIFVNVFLIFYIKANTKILLCLRIDIIVNASVNFLVRFRVEALVNEMKLLSKIFCG